MEEGNRERAAKTPSINSNDDRECNGDLSHFTLVEGSTMEILEEDNQERAAKTSSIMQKDDGEHEVDLSSFTSSSSSPAMQKDNGKYEVELSDTLLSKGLIFRIPGLFKMHNEQAYTPYKFSIGPWHFGKTQLLHTGQKLKESFFEGLINRFPNPAAKKSQLEEAIKNVRGKVQECYEGGDVFDEVDNIEFEKILLLDGCFIIELCRKNFVDVPRGENESLLFSGGMMQVIYHDLLLLENQIPWFVLELLFNTTRNDLERMSFTLVELAIKFFSCAISRYEPGELRRLQIGLQSRNDTKFIHLVDFVWHFLCFSSEMGGIIEKLGYREFEDRTLIPSVTRLKEAGVKFQKALSRNIMDVRFNKGVLEIPPLLITPSTETIFRNLIIFEQCSLRCRPSVTCYAILLDCLVDTADDVDLMSRAGILNNWINPEETAKFLNRVRDNTPIGEFFYVQLCEDVNRHCKTRWPTWRASLIHNYFTKPWAMVSVIFAMIVLFFTIMQVFYK